MFKNHFDLDTTLKVHFETEKNDFCMFQVHILDLNVHNFLSHSLLLDLKVHNQLFSILSLDKGGPYWNCRKS